MGGFEVNPTLFPPDSLLAPEEKGLGITPPPGLLVLDMKPLLDALLDILYENELLEKGFEVNPEDDEEAVKGRDGLEEIELLD